MTRLANFASFDKSLHNACDAIDERAMFAALSERQASKTKLVCNWRDFLFEVSRSEEGCWRAADTVPVALVDLGLTDDWYHMIAAP
ncbi:MAG: hypothetical protein DI540_15615 [Sphingobium sp.]|jgi:hypothetical protein|nr:MAG: hypothetical protein DI540_15615 [Sphingobium sp.]